MNDLIQIGRKIQLARRTRGFTQVQLAKKLGLSWEMISRYERGKTSPINRLLKLSEVLTVPLEFFLQKHIKIPDLPQTDDIKQLIIKEQPSLNDGWHKIFVPLLRNLKEYDQWKTNPTSIEAMYVQPWWMATYDGVFVIKLKDCHNEDLTIHAHTKAMVFATTEPKEKESEYTLIAKNDCITIVRDIDSTSKVIGAILALEQRFM